MLYKSKKILHVILSIKIRVLNFIIIKIKIFMALNIYLCTLSQNVGILEPALRTFSPKAALFPTFESPSYIAPYKLHKALYNRF